MTVGVRVLAPGAMTTVQDLGRTGSRHLGVGLSGALDPYSHTIANLLVGNPADAATLEITLTGPTLTFTTGAVVAISGADVDVRADGIELPGWRPIRLPAGTTLSIGACRKGTRAYLAISGGIRVPAVLGSASTDLRGVFGGMSGRALMRGDVMDIARAGIAIPQLDIPDWWIDPSPELQWDVPAFARVLPPDDAGTSPHDLFASSWRVATASNRQGLRFEGTTITHDAPAPISEPVLPGTVQLPPDGRPIVLMADAQTHGGYPRIGHVIRADWPRLAQLRPGERVRFRPCTPEEASQARLDQSHRLARIALAIAGRRQATPSGR
jgi:antagonist of KipI